MQQALRVTSQVTPNINYLILSVTFIRFRPYIQFLFIAGKLESCVTMGWVESGFAETEFGWIVLGWVDSGHKVWSLVHLYIF